MKFLVDGNYKCTTQISRLKNIIKEHEFKVYDPESYPFEGLNITALQYCERPDEEEGTVLISTDEELFPSNNEYVTSTLDFDKALEWCDCYVTFFDPTEELSRSRNNFESYKVIQAYLDRIQKAVDNNKYIYLSNCLNKEYKKILENYDKVYDKILTEKELKDIRMYAGNYWTDGLKKADITLVLGTGSGSSKFTSSFMVAKDMISKGLKPAIIHTEESGIFFKDNTLNVPCYTFNRNLSTLDPLQEYEYLQCLIAKVFYETSCTNIIMVGQSGLGLHSINVYPYQVYDKNAETILRPKNLVNTMLLHSIGCKDVVICSNIDNYVNITQMVKYFNCSNTPVRNIFLSPTKTCQSNDLDIKYGQDWVYIDGKKARVNSLHNRQDVWQVLALVKRNHPYTLVICDYMNLQQNLDNWCADKDGLVTFLTKTIVDEILGNLHVEFELRDRNYCIDGVKDEFLAELAKHENSELHFPYLRSILELNNYYMNTAGLGY